MKYKLIIVEPGFQSYKEPIIRAIAETGLVNLYFATGLKSQLLSEWVDSYSNGNILFSYSENNLFEKIKEYQIEKNIRFDGAFTYIETSVHFVNQLQQKMGWAAISNFQGKEIRSKIRMRQLFSAAGVNQPTFFVAAPTKCDVESKAKIIKYPLIVKPSEMMASLAVRKTAGPTDLHLAITAAATADFEGESLRELYGDISNEVLIEEYIAGDEFSVEVMVTNGHPRILGITKKQTTNEYFFDELGHEFPAPGMTGELTSKIQDLVEKTHKALLLRNTFTHLEVRVRDRIPYVIELNCRIGGDLISELIRKSKYPNLGSIFVYVCLGMEPVIEEREYLEPSAIKFFTTSKMGRVLRVPEVKSVNYDATVDFFISEGDIVSPGRDNGTFRLGYTLGTSSQVSKVFPKISAEFDVFETLAQDELESREILVLPALLKDLPELISVENAAWQADQAASLETIEKRLRSRTDSTIIAVELRTGRVLGFLVSVVTKQFSFGNVKPWSTYAAEASIKQSGNVHYGVGDTLFLVSASVVPTAPKGVGSLLMTATIEQAKRLGIETVAYGARITTMKERLTRGATQDEVFQDLLRQQIIEPSVQIGVKSGFRPARLIPNYFIDTSSMNFGVLMTFGTDPLSTTTPKQTVPFQNRQVKVGLR